MFILIFIYKGVHPDFYMVAMAFVLPQTEDTDDLKYATVSFAKKPPPRTPKDRKSQDIYSEVRVR